VLWKSYTIDVLYSLPGFGVMLESAETRNRLCAQFVPQ